LDLFSTIYDATVVFVGLGTDPDTGVMEESLGTLVGGENNFFIPEFSGERVILTGASVEGGRTDIFAGGPNGILGSLDDPATFENLLFSDRGEFAFRDVTFYRIGDDGEISKFANATFTADNLTITDVPEPPMWGICAAWLAVLGGLRLRLRRCIPFCSTA
jgi:hypothetical protein